MSSTPINGFRVRLPRRGITSEMMEEKGKWGKIPHFRSKKATP